MQQKIPFLFRKTQSNLFTLPVLFHALEKNGLDRFFILGTIDSPDQIIFKREKPFIIACSFMTPHLPEVWSEIKRIREMYGDSVLLIAGGPHPAGDPEGTLKIGLDVVSKGDGEETLPRICQDFLKEGMGISGKIYASEKRFPLDESFPISNHIPVMSPLEITRGCHNGCKFCQTAGTKPVHRSVESVRVYLDELIRRNYLFRVGFICPGGFEYGSNKPCEMNLEKVETILRMFSEQKIRHLEYGIFPSEIRPNTVTSRGLELIKKYCSNRKVTIGAQSGSDAMLRKVSRGHTTDDIERAAALIHEHGLKPQLDFILGFPGETEEDQILTLKMMNRLTINYQAKNHAHYFIPISGTPLEDRTPAPLSKKIMNMLDTLFKDGVCTNWWKEGMRLSRRVVKVQKEILDI